MIPNPSHPSRSLVSPCCSSPQVSDQPIHVWRDNHHRRLYWGLLVISTHGLWSLNNENCVSFSNRSSWSHKMYLKLNWNPWTSIPTPLKYLRARKHLAETTCASSRAESLASRGEVASGMSSKVIWWTSGSQQFFHLLSFTWDVVWNMQWIHIERGYSMAISGSIIPGLLCNYPSNAWIPHSKNVPTALWAKQLCPKWSHKRSCVPRKQGICDSIHPLVAILGLQFTVPRSVRASSDVRKHLRREEAAKNDWIRSSWPHPYGHQQKEE